MGWLGWKGDSEVKRESGDAEMPDSRAMLGDHLMRMIYPGCAGVWKRYLPQSEEAFTSRRPFGRLPGFTQAARSQAL
jgi:hypothetical protein